MKPQNTIRNISILAFILVIIVAISYFSNQQKTIPKNTTTNLIKVTSPLPNTKVSSPLNITGEARGGWYFEASFPVFLTDWDGKIIAQGVAMAQGNWMTSEFVPFKATLTFKESDISGQYSQKGSLILKRDNPSGLPQNDSSLEIPLIFN